MVYIADNALHLTPEATVHRLLGRHDEAIVVLPEAVLVMGGVARGRITVKTGATCVIVGMAEGSIVCEPGGTLLVAEGAWCRLPGELNTSPIVNGEFIDLREIFVERTSVNDLSVLYRWDGTHAELWSSHLRVGAYPRG